MRARLIVLCLLLCGAGTHTIDTGLPSQVISNLSKGLLVSLPLTATYLDSNGRPQSNAPSRLVASAGVGAVSYDATGATFNGSSYVTYDPTDQAALFVGDFTIAFWLKFTDTSLDVPFSYLVTDGANQWQFATNTGATGRIRFFCAVGGVTQLNIVSSVSGYNDGNWHLVLATRSGSAVTMYVDNNSVASGSTSTTMGSAGTFVVGRISPGNEFLGSAQGFRIYNWAFTAADRANLYAVGPKALIQKVSP